MSKVKDALLKEQEQKDKEIDYKLYNETLPDHCAYDDVVDELYEEEE